MRFNFFSNWSFDSWLCSISSKNSFTMVLRSSFEIVASFTAREMMLGVSGFSILCDDRFWRSISPFSRVGTLSVPLDLRPGNNFLGLFESAKVLRFKF